MKVVRFSIGREYMKACFLISSNTRWVIARKTDIEQACKRSWVSTGRECGVGLKMENVSGWIFNQDGSAVSAPLAIMGIHCYFDKLTSQFSRRLCVNIASEVSATLDVMYQQVPVFMHEVEEGNWFTNESLATKEKISTGTTEDHDVPDLLKASHDFTQNS